MKKLVILSILFLGIFCHANATNLRGQILHNFQHGASPAAGIRVDLFIWNGQQWVNWSYAITGDDGFYYFVNVQPGANFCIQVGGKYYTPHPEKISDTAPPNYQDIQPVVI